MTKPKKVVIPVAGLGTRALPFTKQVPKEFLPILDTPTIHFIVEEVVRAGIEQVIFVTSKGKSLLEDYFDPSPDLESFLRKKGKDTLADKVRDTGSMCEVITVRQKAPLGLGHAVLCAKPVVGNDPFVVCLGDEIFPNWPVDGKLAAKSVLSTLIDGAVSKNVSVVGVVEIPKSDTQSYGVVDVGGVIPDEPSKVLRTVEKPKPEAAPSPFAIIGRYVFQPEIMDCLKEVKPGVGGEIQLTDAMDMLAKAGKLYAQKVTGLRYDIGNFYYYLKAQIDLALQRPDLAPKVREYLKTFSQ
jgi:UTP--glucose-1-phosphate uridylyltransferase